MSNKIFKINFVLFLLINIVNGQTTQWSLIWDQNPEPDINQYFIYKDTSPAPTTLIDSVAYPDTVFADNAISKGILYYYRVKAKNDTGTISLFSESQSAAIPQIVNWADTLRLAADSTHTFDLDNHINDPDNSAGELDWFVNGNTPNLSAQITQSNHVATIQTLPGWNSLGNLIYTVVDPDSFLDVRSLIITPARQPLISNQISDTSYAEDTGPLTVVDNLNNVFSDPDPGDILTFEAGSDNPDLIASIQGNTLIVNSTHNYYGNGNITVTATDLYGLSVSDFFAVIITAVNDAPEITDIPDQIIHTDSTFSDIFLDNYVNDVDHLNDVLVWSFYGAESLNINIDTSRIATIQKPYPDWTGLETVTFRVTDPLGNYDEDIVNFVCLSDSQGPIVIKIPDQTTTEGNSFTAFDLDNFVFDYNYSSSEMTWEISGYNDLNVTLLANNIVNVVPPDVNWNGTELLSFRATNPDSLTNENTAVFTVIPVNDPPQISSININPINIGETFAKIYLDNYIYDVDNSKNEIVWSFQGQNNLSISLDTSRTASVTVLDSTWSGTENITFMATDAGGLSDREIVQFRVINPDDTVQISQIPWQTIQEGEVFNPIFLDNYVSNTNVSWSVRDTINLSVNIDAQNIAAISLPDSNWHGIEILTFVATDTNGSVGECKVVFNVIPVNDAPVLMQIPPQTIIKGKSFNPIFLDNYVDDVDNTNSEMTWTGITPEFLTINIDANRVATIGIINLNWTGTTEVRFQVRDPEGLLAENAAFFTINQENSENIYNVKIDKFGSGTNFRLIWDTSIKTSDFVEYGLDETYGDTVNAEGFQDYKHYCLLEGLQPEMTYHFRIVSEDTNEIRFYSTDNLLLTGKSGGINVFPIPYRAGEILENDAINFVNLPQSSTILIYNLLGELVFKQENITHLYRWSVQNNAGRNIQSGLYIYVVKGNENKKLASGKLIIIR